MPFVPREIGVEMLFRVPPLTHNGLVIPGNFQLVPQLSEEPALTVQQGVEMMELMKRIIAECGNCFTDLCGWLNQVNSAVERCTVESQAAVCHLDSQLRNTHQNVDTLANEVRQQ